MLSPMEVTSLPSFPGKREWPQTLELLSVDHLGKRVQPALVLPLGTPKEGLRDAELPLNSHPNWL